MDDQRCPEGMEQLEKLKKLLEGSPRLSSNIKKEKLIKDIIIAAKNLVNADHAHIRVIDWFNNKLVLEELVKEDNELRRSEFFSLEVGKAIGGQAFKRRKPICLQDAKEDEGFLKYLKEIEGTKEESSKVLINFLKRIGPAIVVPLLLEKKPIGVLAAVRLKKEENSDLPPPFDTSDIEILEQFANQASVALRNAWLFEAAIWQPPKKGDDGPLSVETLCDEVIEEVIKKTGAKDGRVRFVNWEKKFLVPGSLEWLTKSERDSRVCVREIGVCPAGVVAEKQIPLIVNNLKQDDNFKKFLKQTKFFEESYKYQLEALRVFKRDIQDNEDNLKNKLNEYIHKYAELPQVQKDYEQDSLREMRDTLMSELMKRFNVQQLLIDNPKKFADTLEKQIKIVEDLYKSYEEYNADIEKLKSEVAVPILLGNRLLGVLNVHSDEEGWFTESDQAILQAFSGRIATSIMEHQQEVFSSIHKIEQRMIADQIFERVAARITEGIREVAFLAGTEKLKYIFPLLYICKKPMTPQKLLDCRQSFGEMFYPQQADSARDEERDLLNVPIRNNGLGFEAVEELAKNADESIMIVRENVDDPASGGSESAQTRGVMTTACLPLAFGGVVYGLLYIHIKRRYFFTELEQETLSLFGAQAAIVLKNLKRRSEEQSYDKLYGQKLINDCLEINLEEIK